MTKNSTIFVYVILKYPYERTVIKNCIIILQREEGLRKFSALENWMEKGKGSVHERDKKE